MNNLKNAILYNFYGKKKTCWGLLLLHRGLRTCFRQALHNEPDLKQKPSSKRHTFIKPAKEHSNYVYYSLREIV